MTMILFFTLVVGVVVFGGLTLTYLRDARSSRPTPTCTQEDDGLSPAHDRAA